MVDFLVDRYSACKINSKIFSGLFLLFQSTTSLSHWSKRPYDSSDKLMTTWRTERLAFERTRDKKMWQLKCCSAITTCLWQGDLQRQCNAFPIKWNGSIFTNFTQCSSAKSFFFISLALISVHQKPKWGCFSWSSKVPFMQPIHSIAMPHNALCLFSLDLLIFKPATATTVLSDKITIVR